jgi:hypothetical protein
MNARTFANILDNFKPITLVNKLREIKSMYSKLFFNSIGKNDVQKYGNEWIFIGLN